MILNYIDCFLNEAEDFFPKFIIARITFLHCIFNSYVIIKIHIFIIKNQKKFSTSQIYKKRNYIKKVTPRHL